MTLLGTGGMLGLGTLLIGELPRRRGEAASLIGFALVASGIAGACLGIVFAVTATYISTDLTPLAASIGSVALFAIGVSLTAIGLVLDEALIGLLRGDLQFGRNLIHAFSKLLVLFLAGNLIRGGNGLMVYGSWVVGNLVSLASLTALAAFRGVRINHLRFPREISWGLGAVALTHHALNLALQGPGLVLPILVIALLFAEVNATFYVAWMIASLVAVASASLTLGTLCRGRVNSARTCTKNSIHLQNGACFRPSS